MTVVICNVTPSYCLFAEYSFKPSPRQLPFGNVEQVLDSQLFSAIE